MAPNHPARTRSGPSPATAASSDACAQKPVAKAGPDPRVLRRLLRAKDQMDLAPQDAWSVERLARVSGVSPAHFARSFKAAFGVPPHRYLLTRRLERAMTLLRRTDASITQIAFDTGWSSLGTFGRTFSDVLGLSPSALRARERSRPFDLDHAPACFVAAAQRPNLTTAVSEKRRRGALAKTSGKVREVQ